MQNFHQWLESNHPELQEGFLKNAALAGAMALGAAAPDYAQAAEQPTTTQQDQMQQLRDRQAQRRNTYKLPMMMGLMGAAAAARAARKRREQNQ